MTFFSKRTDWDLTTNALAQTVQKRRDSGLEILDLTESNPTRCDFHYPTQGITDSLTQPKSFIYTPHPKGLPEAREAITLNYQRLGIHVNPDHIFLTASTSEAYSFIFRLITNPGDSILVPEPSYPLFNFLADINDLTLHSYSLVYSKGWQIDFDTLENRIQPNTRAILLVHPNNPTGSYIKASEMNSLIQIAQKHHLAIISDEVFFDYGFKITPSSQKTFAGSSEALTFTLNGISKMAGLPQMKLAWIIVTGPEPLRSKALSRLEIISDTYLSVNTPVQQALPCILKTKNVIQDQIKNRLKLNLDFLKTTVSHYPACEALEVEGGWNAILRIPLTQSDETWALTLLEKEGILIYPGHFYNFDKEGYLVASLLPSSEIFNEGIKKIFRHLHQ